MQLSVMTRTLFLSSTDETCFLFHNERKKKSYVEGTKIYIGENKFVNHIVFFTVLVITYEKILGFSLNQSMNIYYDCF